MSAQSAALGSIAGNLSQARGNVLVGLLGTSYFALTDSGGSFRIPDVPAGDHQVAIVHAADYWSVEKITVNPGEEVQLSRPLPFGPQISTVTPEGIWWGDDPAKERSPIIEILGSGFGNQVGLSRIEYGKLDVSGAVLSWENTRIVIDSARMFNQNISVITNDDLRFTVVTPLGEATTSRVAAVRGALYADSPQENWVQFSIFNSLVFIGLEFELSAPSAEFFDYPTGEPLNGSFFTKPRTSMQDFSVELEGSSLGPVVGTLGFEGIELGQAVVANFSHASLGQVVSAPPYWLQLTLTYHDEFSKEERYFPIDGRVTYSISNDEEDEHIRGLGWYCSVHDPIENRPFWALSTQNTWPTYIEYSTEISIPGSEPDCDLPIFIKFKGVKIAEPLISLSDLDL